MLANRNPKPGESGHCPSCRHQPPRHQLANLCHHPDEDIRNLRVDVSDGCPGYEYNLGWESDGQGGQADLFSEGA